MMRLMGKAVVIVPSWRAWRYLGPPERVPSKAEGRKGTRRSWKAARWTRRGWCWVWVDLESPMVSPTTIYLSAAQLAAIRRKLSENDNGLSGFRATQIIVDDMGL